MINIFGGRKALLRTLALGGLIALALMDPVTVVDAARQSCRIWAESVMPALFPFVTLSLLLVSGLGGSNGLHGSSGSSGMITGVTIALGMLGGSPSGARLLSQRAADGRLSRRAAQCAAACITTASPMFILATLTNWLGTDRRIGLTMLIAHELAAIAAGLICLSWTRGWDGASDGSLHNDYTLPVKRDSTKLTFGDAIAQAANAMLMVCGCMILFSAALAVALKWFAMPPTLAAVLAAVLEMASGSAKLAKLGLPARDAAPLLCAAVTFGGASVFMQNAAHLRKAGVNMGIQLAARILAGTLAFLLCVGFMGNVAAMLGAVMLAITASFVKIN